MRMQLLHLNSVVEFAYIFRSHKHIQLVRGVDQMQIFSDFFFFGKKYLVILIDKFNHICG